MKSVIVFVLSVLPLLAQQTPESRRRTALQTKTGTIALPAGVIEISREITLPADAHDLNITGTNTTIKASATFAAARCSCSPRAKTSPSATLARWQSRRISRTDRSAAARSHALASGCQ